MSLNTLISLGCDRDLALEGLRRVGTEAGSLGFDGVNKVLDLMPLLQKEREARFMSEIKVTEEVKVETKVKLVKKVSEVKETPKKEEEKDWDAPVFRVA